MLNTNESSNHQGDAQDDVLVQFLNKRDKMIKGVFENQESEQSKSGESSGESIESMVDEYLARRGELEDTWCEVLDEESSPGYQRALYEVVHAREKRQNDALYARIEASVDLLVTVDRCCRESMGDAIIEQEYNCVKNLLSQGDRYDVRHDTICEGNTAEEYAIKRDNSVLMQLFHSSENAGK